MPDGDVIERGLRRRWKRPYRLLGSGVSDREVARSILKALAAQLRDDCGVPSFQATAGVLETLLRDGNREAAYSRLRRLRLTTSRSEMLLDDAARACIAQVGAGQVSPTDMIDTAGYLARTLLSRSVDSGFAGRIRPDLVAEGRDVVRAFEARMGAIMRIAEPAIQSLAETLVADPSAQGLRASSVGPRQRLTTDALLNVSLLD